MDIRAILAQVPLFSRLSPEALDAFAERVQVTEVKSGDVLLRQGDIATAAYVVAAGRLRAVLADGTVAGDIGKFELLGEIAVFAGEPRSASVHAVRDSIVLGINRKDLLRLVNAYPMALIGITRIIIKRLRQNQRSRTLQSARTARTFAIIPASGDVDAHAFAETFCEALATCQVIPDRSKIKLVDDVFVDSELGAGAAQSPFVDNEANTRLMTLLGEVEDQHRYLVYAAGGDANPWARRCMRQADHILLVANNDAMPLVTPMIDLLIHGSASRAPVNLVLLRSNGEAAGEVLRWRELVRAASHFFAQPNDAGDYSSLARKLTGRGIGLVLGGGGARGFAHIGLLRALRELNIPVDATGGSSMGAFLAALHACGYDHNEVTHIARETFVRHNYLNDYMFPTVAMIRGRKFVRRLHEIFEERQIESLRTPYFCVSTNLTRGTTMVHDRGPLYMWLACSMCVPGVAPPVAYKGELLADGSVIDSLPTDIMHEKRLGPIIASDVSTAGDLSVPGIEGPDPEGLLSWRAPGGKRPGFFSIMFRTATLTSDSATAARAAQADVYVRMPVTGIGLFDWKRIDDVIERGYRHALEKLTPLRDAVLK
ncbi:MAG TPA: patatin-like phospholipase family protein [Stenotrophobium sp.]|nr:patatin-like phospholipase family protein [Stenotrophobium sp.]